MFIRFVIPSFFESVHTIIKNLPEYNDHIYDYAKDHFDVSKKDFDKTVSKVTKYINKTEMNTNNIMNNIASASISIFYSLINITIGLIVSIYLLYDKVFYQKTHMKVFWTP